MSVETASALVNELYAGTPAAAGCRVNHARGILVEGRFRPCAEAQALTEAAIFAESDQPALVRFSSSTGNPRISQDDHAANPRGIAVQIGQPPTFVLVGHSVEAFPARNGDGFLTFLKALNEGTDHPGLIDQYMNEHEAARRFAGVRAVQPSRSFAEGAYHMLHPFRLTRRDGGSVVGRLTVDGVGQPRRKLRDAVYGADCLDRELRARLEAAGVELVLRFQRAPADVDIEDISAPWPGGGENTELGRIMLTHLAANQEAQKRLTFDPGVLPLGITFAGDPMIEVRLAAYHLAFQRRLGFAHS
ncbi:catalase [Lichenicoccus sp.]|uniref:catalase n=1 Tax=Lichenicoccus sp. TaxID=2781899 RepID=UPI003D0C2ED8